MRIVHVIPNLVRESAGVREVVLGLAKAQKASDVDVAVLALQHNDWEAEKHDWDGIFTKQVLGFGPAKFGYSPHLTSALIKMDPDIVHLHGLWMHPGRSVLQWHRTTNKPYIVSVHGMLSDVALSYASWKKSFVSMWFQNSVFDGAAAIHVTSEQEAKEVMNYGLSSPTIMVQNGISDISLPVNGAEAEASRTILSLGRIHKKKALGNLITAWKELQDDFPDWSVEIVGPDEGGEVARLSSLIQANSIKRVSISGPIYGEQKARLIAKAGVFALPTLSENFAITVGESLISGVPVVSSQGAPWSRLETERCGFWVPIGSSHMAEALRLILSLTDSERQQMGARGRAWMLNEMSWTSVAKQMQNCYQEVVGSKAKGAQSSTIST